MKIILDVKSILDLSNDELFANLSALNPSLRLEVNCFQQLIIAMGTKHKTGNTNARLIGRLDAWNEENELGEIFDSSTNFRMPITNSVFSPDLSWIENSRLEKIWDIEGYLKIAPDFVGELRSDSDSLAELKRKMEEYMENGVRLGWLIDPKGEKIYIYRLQGENSEQSFDEKLVGEDVLPNLEIDMKKLIRK
ncbi:MAG: Uma2 family endonuclease [Bacteroidetes bacterium]|nr:MAG: Uma2 family endonuclease [Bacteroidota bacterium]